MIEFEAMFPVMVAPNLQALKEFYETIFGFNAVFFDPQFYLHLVSPSTGVQLAFLMPNHPSQPEFLHTVMSVEGYVISLEVQDAAKAYTEAQKLNLNVLLALKEEEWGQLHFMVKDPAGLAIDVVQHLEVSEH